MNLQETDHVMASKTPGKNGGTSKSEEIRKLATAMKAAGKKPRPSVILTELDKKGVKVSSPQVSMVLKKMGFRPLRRRKKGVAASKPTSKQAGATKAVSVADLLAAKKMAASMGGTTKAIAALQALKQFEG
jgi:hypothetical protein